VTDCTLEAIDDGSASGFVFHDFSTDGLRQALRRAFALQRRPADWARVQQQAMQRRFDWQEAALAYCALYRQLAGPSAPHPA
jgi:starch synthase